MEAAQERPPYVMFEMRSVEDRAESEEQGHYVGRDVVFALITPMGSKDRIERVADEWIKYLKEQARDGRFNPEWIRQYEFGLQEFKAGREVPENGTPIFGWHMVSPTQQQLIVSTGIRTVEDLALANESAIQLMGIGGRGFKQKAQAWLDSREDGKGAMELEKLRAQNEQQAETITSLTEKVGELVKQVEKLTAKDK